ncbi:hypothetical protein ABJZ01_13255, partial [Vibrio parahaemolyticus]
MNKLIDALATDGYYIWDDFLSEDEVTQLRDCIPDNWKKARIGRNDDVTRIESIRSDKIQWLKPAMGQPIANYLSKMEEIRQEVNRHFFLGLFEYEAHFAKYEKGDFYQKHLDCFKGNENRRLTTAFFKVVVIICLLIKQLLFLDLGELHQLVQRHHARSDVAGDRLYDDFAFANCTSG